jgi:alanyl-tRNA synthetase
MEKLIHDLQIQTKAPRPEELNLKITQLQQELKAAQEKVQAANKQSIASQIDKLLSAATKVGDSYIICAELPGADKEALREAADLLRTKAKSAAILLASSTTVEGEPKVHLIAAVTKDLITKGLKAGECIKQVAPLVQGAGGGRPDLAEAGGKDPGGIAEVLRVAREIYFVIR